MLNRIPSMFKANRPRSFEYKPLYYDEDKDRVKQRLELAETEMTLDEKEVAHEIRLEQLRGRLRNRWDSNRFEKTDPKKADFARRMRLFVIFGGLCFLFYYVLF